MKTTKMMIRAALVALMLFSGITNGAHAFLGGGVSIGAEGTAVMRIKGKVFCAGCKLEEVRKAQPQEPRLYQLTYDQGQVVMKVDWVSNPRRWNHVVWPGIVIGEWGLTTCIYELRQALRDTTRPPRFIETVYRRGYRFIAPLSAHPSATRTNSPIVTEAADRFRDWRYTSVR